ncbi:transglutaminase-like cysteine peptidase [Ancylobacter sp. 6x-1]|uniref:Transglutaminase-like cysteine peptidase n=1 Tax=Ancylobacter crimeensis TaxID=2579147 RepID=A0ABT0DF52_9HYPH|nr:transglutaminase-like cysteine peptidase [Ancylobacter crimeensis]MCK0198577.1 transglutaminase-like cysteine peptidase [Ancylobacter crimeensis]
MKKRLELALIAALAGIVLGGAFAVNAANAATTSGTPGTQQRSAATRAQGMHLAMLPPAQAAVASMSTGRETGAPIGYANFCRAQPGECGPGNGHGGQVVLDEETYAQLSSVNEDINTRIKPLSDLEHYGVEELWTYPDDGYGDCEDYVLLKRRTLIGLGWPAETLLITVVRDQHGDGHSVLTVVTDHGDLVLDNQDSRILPWFQTPYRYVKRQVQGEPDRWVSLGNVIAPAIVGGN